MPAFAVRLVASSRSRGRREITQVVEAADEFVALEAALREARLFVNEDDVVEASRDRRYSIERLVG